MRPEAVAYFGNPRLFHVLFHHGLPLVTVVADDASESTSWSNRFRRESPRQALSCVDRKCGLLNIHRDKEKRWGGHCIAWIDAGAGPIVHGYKLRLLRLRTSEEPPPQSLSLAQNTSFGETRPCFLPGSLS